MASHQAPLPKALYDTGSASSCTSTAGDRDQRRRRANPRHTHPSAIAPIAARTTTIHASVPSCAWCPAAISATVITADDASAAASTATTTDAAMSGQRAPPDGAADLAGTGLDFDGAADFGGAAARVGAVDDAADRVLCGTQQA